MSTISVDRIIPYQSGSVTVESLNLSTLTIGGALTASIQEGYVLAGGAGDVSKLVATSSFGGGGSTDISLLNSFTQSADDRFTNLELTSASHDDRLNQLETETGSIESEQSIQDDRLNNLELTSASHDDRLNNLELTSASHDDRLNNLELSTGSFATTNSNTFTGTQTISGSILVSGSVNADGFELDGSTTTTIPVLNEEFNSDFSSSASIQIYKSLVLGDGKVLVAGRFENIDGHTTNDIARFNSDGTIDTGFTSPIFGGYFGGDVAGYINTFVTQSDGKIIVGGNFGEVDGHINLTGLVRLNSNGTLDNSFTSQSWGSFGEVRDIAIQNDGKIVCVGYFTSGSRRINTDGTLDTSFNISQGNSQATSFNNGDFYSVALLDSGSEQAILIGGKFVQWGSYSYPYLVKLNPNGTLDFGFAGSNLDLTTGGDYTDRIEKIKVGDDGYIYVAGKYRDTGIGNNAGFARITTTDEGNGVGAIDTGFRTYISGSFVNDFDFYDGDKVLLGGDFTVFGNPAVSTTSANRFAIIRQSNGGLITNWTTDGLASKYNLNTGSVNSVSLLSGDNVLVGGTFTQANSTARESLASLKLTGYGDVTTTSEYAITADSTELLVSSSNTRFSGDVNIIGNVTASIQEGYVLAGGAGDVSVLVATSSLSGDSFPYTGDAVISGSLTISGSISQVGIGTNNTFIGSGSGVSNTSGGWNVFVGVMSGNSNTTAEANTFIGESAGLSNTIGAGNTFVGAFSAIANTTGANNSVLGLYAAESNTTGYNNTFIGNSSGNNNTEGFGNTFIGRNAGSGNIVGYYNVAVGESAGSSIASSNASVFIGYNAQPQSNLQSNQIVIGNSVTGNGSNTTTIGNNSTTATYLKGTLNVSTAILAQVSSSYDFADDAAAASGGVPLGGLYHTSGSVKIRLV